MSRRMSSLKTYALSLALRSNLGEKKCYGPTSRPKPELVWGGQTLTTKGSRKYCFVGAKSGTAIETKGVPEADAMIGARSVFQETERAGRGSEAYRMFPGYN